MSETTANAVRVSAPSRLHFGLFSIGDQTPLQYGGAGMMIASPRTTVRVGPAKSLKLSLASSHMDSVAKRVSSVADNWFAFHQAELAVRFGTVRVEDLPVEITLENMAPRHSGFGSGTQLALAVGLALTEALKLPPPGAAELALAVDRGKRSAIGSHGFFRGGFLVDRGKSAEHSLAPLELQIPFPEDWRVVTVLRSDAENMFGYLEKQAFDDLPPSTQGHRQTMIDMIKRDVAPALMAKNFDLFSDSLFEFGRRSGLMYEAVQGSAYNGQTIQETVNAIREFGVPGAGQSSWGPCVYAITRSNRQADDLAKYLCDRLGDAAAVEIHAGDNHGATIECL